MFDERAYMREYRKRNAEKIREQKRALYWKNPAASRVANKRSYDRHAPQRIAKAQEYYSRTKAARADKIRASCKNWRRAHPEHARALVLNRRSRIAAAGGVLAPADISAIVARQRGKCAACGTKTKLAMDHIMPPGLGGGGHRANFQGLCTPCNSRKRDKHPIDFNRSLGLLL